MPAAEFVHLHLHTEYSLLDGAIRIRDLINKVKEYKMPAVAITDHGNLFGAMEFYGKVRAGGLKPIVGCEVYVAPESRFKQSARTGEHTAYHLVLLCENEKGYRNLCKLVSKGYQEGFYYKPRIDRELLEKYNSGLVCLSGCLSGEPASLIKNGKEKEALEAAAWYRDLFGDQRYYLELQENGLPEQRQANQGLTEIAKNLGLKLVATNDCHYLNQADHRAHEVLLCIQTGKQLDDVNRMSFSSDQFYVKSPEEMAHDFRHVPEALKSTMEIAEKCSLLLEFGQVHMPRFDVGKRKLRDIFEEDARKGLVWRFDAMRQRGELNDESEKIYKERLDTEIHLIQEMGFSGYFLIVADFINYARSHDVPVGPGRGSAAGSLAAYSLGITDIDPIKYNLLFERFLNPERKSMPDIDVDFCMDGREKVIEYVSQKYGKDNVAQIITFGRMHAKAVIRDTARVLGLPYAEADKLAKLVPDTLKMTLNQALNEEPRLKDEMSRPEIADLINTAKSLEGLIRHASTHAAGIVISDKPLVEHLPLYVGPNKETITQFDMTWVEKIGLVKFDFLGLKTLTVLDQALKLIEKTRGTKVDIGAIPLDDGKVFDLLARGDTMGVFQLESSGMRDVLTKMKPSLFEDLIAINALYRPGPLESGMVDDFINRKHGRTPIEYPLPQLEPILKETYGVILYQEQVMNIATSLGSYSLGEADLLRRAMGKKKPEEMAEQKSRFEKGAIKNSIKPERAAFIFDLMAKFAGYGFNKSHSAAYALVAYQTAYLKTHFPAEFMAAQLSCEAGNTDKVTLYISECRAMGIDVLPPHVNASFQNFHVVDGKIVFGLGAIKNVGEGAINSIIEARSKNGDFCNIQDFVRRVDLRKVNKKVVESLIKAGAFDGMGPTRRAMSTSLDGILEHGASFQKEQDAGQTNLFALECQPGQSSSMTDEPIPDVPEWAELIKLQFEREMIGFYITGHPLANFEELTKRYTNADTGTVAAMTQGAQVRMAGMVKGSKEITTKKGDRMAFITLEDLNGTIEVTVFSDLYAKSRDLLQSGEPMIVFGTKNGEDETPKLLAQDMFHIEDAPKRMSKYMKLKLAARQTDPKQIKDLRKLLFRHKGGMPVKISVTIPGRTDTLISLGSNSCDPSDALLAELRNSFGPNAVSFE